MVEFLEVATQVIVAAANHIAETAVLTAKVQASTSLPRLSCPKLIVPVWAAAERCIIQCKKIRDQTPHADASESLHASQL